MAPDTWFAMPAPLAWACHPARHGHRQAELAGGTLGPGVGKWILRGSGVFVASVVGVELGLGRLVRHGEAWAEEDD